MSAIPRKPGTPVHSNKPQSPHRDTNNSTNNHHTVNGTVPRTHNRSPSSASPSLSRTPSARASTPVPARVAANRRPRSNLSTSSIPKLNDDPSEEEARAQTASLIADLKEQLQKAENASEQYRKQLDVFQLRLDEAVSEQGKLEDQSHEKESKLEALNAEIRDHVRQIRDLEHLHEKERNAMLQEKEQQASREEEMQATIKRLKESVAQKDMRMGSENDRSNVSRSSSFRNRSSPEVDGQFAPSSQIERSPSRNNSTLLLQKDKLIESLRLELAESQIKLVELENNGGGRQQELEKELLDARMANARLMEDNESYQLLLSERTLNGDFTKGDFMRDVHPDSKEPSSGLGSLADELESVDERAETDNTRKLETEIRNLKDQNKALTLYIERIISRLLQHDGFESILDKNESDPRPTSKPANTGAKNAANTGTGKDNPANGEKDESSSSSTFLQRARSVMGGQNGNRARPARPASFVPPRSINTAHEDPSTAPRIPISRAQSVRAGHRRTRSEQTVDGSAAATVVGHMFQPRIPSGPMSPNMMGPGSRQSVIGGTNYTSGNRTASVSSQQDRNNRLSSSDSVSSDFHGDAVSTPATSSPPRSNNGMTNYTGAVMTQNKLRPLRLVQEASEEEEAARKRANRSSWMSWFSRPTSDDFSKENKGT